MDKLFSNKVCIVCMHQKETGQASGWINRKSKKQGQVWHYQTSTLHIKHTTERTESVCSRTKSTRRGTQGQLHSCAVTPSCSQTLHCAVRGSRVGLDSWGHPVRVLTSALTAKDDQQYSPTGWPKTLTFSQKVICIHLYTCCMSSDAFRGVGIWFQTPCPNRPWCLKTAGDNWPVQSSSYMKECFNCFN